MFLVTGNAGGLGAEPHAAEHAVVLIHHSVIQPSHQAGSRVKAAAVHALIFMQEMSVIRL